jgi:hypothetical protein
MRWNSIGSSAGRLVAVFLGQLEHRVLDGVQRSSSSRNANKRLLVGAFFDAGEKIRQFVRAARIQFSRFCEGVFAFAKCLDQTGGSQ